jgi:hypothetical protein
MAAAGVAQATCAGRDSGQGGCIKTRNRRAAMPTPTARRLTLAVAAFGAFLVQAAAAQPPAPAEPRRVMAEADGGDPRRGGWPGARTTTPDTAAVVVREPTLTRRGTRLLPVAAATEPPDETALVMVREPVMTARGTRMRSVAVPAAPVTVSARTLR